ncbi:MAG: SpoIIE family protein phosphatase [Planctomycetaceae bacterium]
MPGLVVLAPPAQGASYSLNPQRESVIGREGYCDIVLIKRTVSRKHARVFFDGQQYQVEDLGSSHGTFLNGRRVSKATPLKDGDRINIFDVPIAFCATAVPLVDTSQFMLGQTHPMTPLPPTRTQTATLGYSNRLHSLLDITRRLGSNLMVEELFPRVLDLLFDIFPQAIVGEIQLADAAGELTPVAMKHGRDDDSSIITRVPVGNDLANQVLLTGLPLVKSVESGDEESVLDVAGSNTLCVPIIGPSRAKLGTILFETDDDHRVFTEEDVELIGTIGILTGQAIEYAKAHTAVLRLDQTQRQLDTARQIQMRMLPRQRPTLPGYLFESHYEPANSVGGDYYFWDSLPDGRVMMGIADACGKSLPAALLMAQFASEVRHCLATAETLKMALHSLNLFVCGLDEGFITFCLCLLDANTHLLTVMNAGHPTPVVRHHDTGEVESLANTKSSLPLGISPNEKFHPMHMLVRPGDEIFLMTDGLIEAMSPDSNLYGFSRLSKQIGPSQPSLPARFAAIIADVADFRATRSASDDLCLLGIARELA